MTTVVRVRSDTLDLDACLEWIPGRMLEASWRPGDRLLPRQPPATNAGFTLLLSDEADEAKHQSETVSALTGLAAQLKRLADSGATVEVDVALEVGPVRPRTVGFGADFLRLVIDAGAQLVVSAYPCSDA